MREMFRKLKKLVEQLKRTEIKPINIDPQSRNLEKITILRRKYGSNK